MKKFKGLIVTLLIGTSLISLSGCTSKEDKLINALAKTNTLHSFNYKANASVKTNGEAALNTKTPNEFSLEFDGKTVKKDKNLIKSETNIKLGTAGISTDLNLIQQISLDKNKSDFKILIGIPQMLKTELGSMSQNADYIYIDSNGLKKLQELEKAKNLDSKPSTNIDTDKLAANAANIEKSLFLFIKEYTKKDGKGLIKYTGKNSVTINGVDENLETYRVKINNEDLKKLLKAYVKDEKRVTELQDYLTALFPEWSKENKKINSEDLTKQIDKMKNIFGKDGLVMDFAIKDGYIVQEKISADIITETDSITFSINYDIFNINKNVEINFPNKEDVKSVDLVDIISMFNEK